MNTLAIGISYIENDILYGLYDNNNLQTTFTLSELNNINQVNIDSYKIVDQRMVYK